MCSGIVNIIILTTLTLIVCHVPHLDTCISHVSLAMVTMVTSPGGGGQVANTQQKDVSLDYITNIS